ncbi:MAG: YheC/YheD family protein [Paenibacillaceae bacterium]|nr:YheC/YheD family protein [Paenibacillaceae bacterium]
MSLLPLDDYGTRSVGIMTCDRDLAQGPKQAWFATLAACGGELGLLVYVFAPAGVAPDGLSVRGFAAEPGKPGAWRQGDFPPPRVIYDRSFCRSGEERRRQREALALLSERGAVPLSRGVGGKLAMRRALAADTALAPYVPPAAPLENARPLLRLLEERGSAFLKPDAGMQGCGALRVAASGGSWRAEGRDAGNRPFRLIFHDFPALWRWLRRFTAGRRYVLQPYLPLTLPGVGAFDVRALVQKDGDGRWRLVGEAVRIGAAGSVTANVHGGGTAAPLREFLRGAFGDDRAERIVRRLRELAQRIPPALEASCGRLAELGLDFGVEESGRLWIVEANPKPGRTVLRMLGDEAAYAAATTNPMRYANHLLRLKLPKPVLHLPIVPGSRAQNVQEVTS